MGLCVSRIQAPFTTTATASNEISQRIIGGAPVNIINWQYLVWIGHCGGTLIARDWVLTAAHCL